MSQHVEYLDTQYVRVEFTDERNLEYAEAPDAQNVLVLGGSDVVVLTGTSEQLLACLTSAIAAIEAGATPYEANS